MPPTPTEQLLLRPLLLLQLLLLPQQHLLLLLLLHVYVMRSRLATSGSCDVSCLSFFFG